MDQFKRTNGKYRKNRALAAMLATGVAASALSVPVAAQDTGTGVQLEEIQVTARRRTESLQDVPVAVTALGGAMLEDQGLQDIVEVAKFAPNLTLEVSRGTNTTLTAFIRGIGQQDPVAGFEAGVGLYVDDVYLNRPQAAVVDIYDVERIEVLRGPQGTLYGRNTIGGAVKYVTKRISDEPEFNIKGSIGTYEQLDLVVSASAPISDTVRVGGALATLNRDGFGENLTIEGLDNYNKKVLAGRGSIEFLPSDSFFFRVAADFVDDDSDPRQGHRLIPGVASGAPVLDDVYDTRAGLENPEQSVKAYGGSALMEWTASDTLTVKNILAYREDKSRSPIDFDSLAVADLDVPVDYENKQFSEEFQVLYQDDKLSGIFGFYYLDANAFNEFDVILDELGQLIGLPGLNANTLGDVDTSTWSLFADMTYDVSDKISLSFGGRYTSDKRTSQVLRRTFIGGASERFGGDATLIATTSDFNGSDTFKKFTPRGSISWKPNDDNNIYLSYSEGFKGGGFDPRSQTTAAPDLDGDGDIDSEDVFAFMSFDSETVKTFELGWKGSAFDGRMDFSIAGFLSNYTNIQIPGSVGTPEGTFIGVTSNAGDADVNGIEFEGRALLATDMSGSGDSLNMTWAIGYLDAQFNEFIDAFGVDVADERVFQNTPEWTASGSLNYTRPMSFGSRDGALSLITSLAYRSAASQFETPNAFLDQPGFALWDASIVWNADDDDLSVGLHAKNITNKRYIVAGYNFVTAAGAPTLGTEGTLTAFYGNPFTLTATISVGF
ncbi:TonB-dependent receptor [Kordiimonas lipolytica]|jgi:iron complex outermembrane receptor protein|uniref:TonB-dependent receptor n=2 Tax=Kordiimonas lipolytica TaxID=1662421 RepID=A0ABV8U996_9PROT